MMRWRQFIELNWSFSERLSNKDENVICQNIYIIYIQFNKKLMGNQIYLFNPNSRSIIIEQ